MGELSKKLHYKKTDGTQGEVSIYDSLEDCPEPNLKVKVDGIQGYVKLGTADDGETVPIKVKTNTAGVLNVIKTTVPTGSMTLGVQRQKHTDAITCIDFVVPSGVRVIKITGNLGDNTGYIGVTPNKTYKVAAYHTYYHKGGYISGTWKKTGSSVGRETKNGISALIHTTNTSVSSWTISWSPEINNHVINKDAYITD